VSHPSLTQSRVVNGGPIMTPLRRRYIEDLQLKHFASITIKVYVPAVAAFARHIGKSPEQLGFHHVRQYLVHLIQDCGVSRGTYIVHLAALRHLYHVTLNRPGQLEEFKRDAVRLVSEEKYSFQAAATAVGVSEQSLRDWHAKFVPVPRPCGERASLEELRGEVVRLRRELKRAELEREILKKATAYFAKESL
jgi:transposase